VPAAFLALALLTTTVDLLLAEPLRLLADVRDRDGQAIGERYCSIKRDLTSGGVQHP
jgi:hypothetical protein